MLALKVFLHTQSGLSTFSKKETTPMHKVDSYKWLKKENFSIVSPRSGGDCLGGLVIYKRF